LLIIILFRGRALFSLLKLDESLDLKGDNFLVFVKYHYLIYW